MRKICVFGAARGSLPQIIVLKGRKRGKGTVASLLGLFLSLLNLLYKAQLEEKY